MVASVVPTSPAADTVMISPLCCPVAHFPTGISATAPISFPCDDVGVTSTPEHLYVHVPFCAHRCGYCDFVTVSAKPELHAQYVRALTHEHEIRRLPGR